MFLASYIKLICPQIKWASCKMGAAQLLRGKNPKTKALQPRKNIRGLKSLHLLAVVLSALRKAIELQTAGKKSKLKSLLVSVDKDCTENKKLSPK